MAVAVVATTSAVNLNTETTTLFIPIVTLSTAYVNVFVAVNSESASVASVTDSAGNTYTCQCSATAKSEVDYSQGGLSKLPYYNQFVDGELWTAKGSAITAGATAGITVTLTRGARFAVIVQTYTGGGIATTAWATTIVDTVAPSVTFNNLTTGSWLVAGFASARDLNLAATTGNLRNAVGYSNGKSAGGIAVAVVDNTLSTNTGTVTLAPTNVTTLPNGSTTSVPATYVVCALEIKA